MSVQPQTSTNGRRVMPSATEEVREDLRAKARAIVARYPAGKARSALLPMLHLVQSVDGYVSPEGVAFCAEELGLTKAEVGAVATFYTMYKRRPVGEYLVSVCTNTMCGVLGGQKAYDTLSEHLGVGHDQTTEDGTITLEHAECLAACDYAPVLTVNYEFFDQVDADEALEIVKRLQSGDRPHPTRGARLCSFKETSLQLAGFLDERDGGTADGPAGEPTLAGNRIAEERGISVSGFDPNTPIRPVPPKTGAAPPPPAAPKPAADGKPAGDTPPAVEALATAPKPAADSKPAGDTPPVATGPAAGTTEDPQTESAKTQPATTEPAKNESAEAQPADTEPAETEPANTEPVNTEPVNTEPADSGPATASAEPYGAGSIRVGAGTTAAPEGYPIKAIEDSGLYHTPESPSYRRTVAGIWFVSIDAAAAAGFVAWDAPADVRAARKRAAKEGK